MNRLRCGFSSGEGDLRAGIARAYGGSDFDASSSSNCRGSAMSTCGSRGFRATGLRFGNRRWPASTSRSVGQAATLGALDRQIGAGNVVNPEPRSVAVAEVEFVQIPMQVRFGDVLVNPVNATFEDGDTLRRCWYARRPGRIRRARG
jgi:hypothetical protein